MTRDLKEQLRSLGLSHTADVLDDVVALATKNRWGAHQLFEHVARLEAEDRARRSLERRLGRSKLGKFKQMADFDWAWPKRIDREAVESAVSLDFMEKAHNVVLVAPQGLGKTMIAQNIANAAVLAGHSVLFTTAAQLLLDLGAQESARPSTRGCATTAPAPACSLSTRSATSPTTTGTPTSSSRSSPAATSGRASSSRRTWRSPTGRQSSRTRRAPPPSSTASSTTRRSSASRARATASARPSSPRRRPRPAGARSAPDRQVEKFRGSS